MQKSFTCPALLCFALFANTAQATEGAAPAVRPMPPIDVKSYVLMDYQTGQILASKQPEKELPPASTTKLMTAYVTFQALKHGRISLDTMFHVSKKAWGESGSRMFIDVGSDVSVRNLLKGILIPSGNDAAMALAEGVSGSEDAFVDQMNDQARKLGLHNTHFTDPNGLPEPGLHSSAQDLAKLSRAIIRQFPDEYRQFFAIKSFTWNDITQSNYNKLLWRDPSVDGLKPGYVGAVGYNLSASAERDGMRLIAVVMGADKANASSPAQYINLAQVTGALLDYGFDTYTTHKLYDAGQAVMSADVSHGADDTIALGLRQALYVTVPRGQYAKLKASVDLPSSIEAPIAKGQSIGHLIVKLGPNVVAKRPVVALDDDARSSFWSFW